MGVDKITNMILLRPKKPILRAVAGMTTGIQGQTKTLLQEFHLLFIES